MTDNQWFDETCVEAGTRFSFKIKQKVHEEQSSFQTISIYETTDFGYLMVIDDCVMLTTRDNFLYHEMMSHPALYTHPNPQNVAIIGGGDCGTLREVLKHPEVKQATQIDIDERVTRLAEIYFPELCENNNDPRATLLFEDGIDWMKNATENSLDVIIVDSTDPVGPGEKLFTEAFYQACKKALKPNGIIVQQSESPLIHLESITLPMRRTLNQVGFEQVRTFGFPQPCYPSGWWSATMASHDLSQYREHDVEQKPFSTYYYCSVIHRGTTADLPMVKQL